MPPKSIPNPPRFATLIQIPFQQGTLDIWTRVATVAPTSHAYVLEFCGNATPAQWIVNTVAHRWRNLAAEVWVVNYPGYGGSTGPASLDAIPPAALAAYDALAKRAGGHPIFVAGTSMGTTAALYVAAHRPTAGIELQNPPPLRELIMGNYGWWNLWIAASLINRQIPSEMDSIKNAACVSVPGVFVLADHDGLVPPRFQKLIVDAFAGPKKLITLKGANHDSQNTELQDIEIEAAIDWMMEESKKEVLNGEGQRGKEEKKME